MLRKYFWLEDAPTGANVAAHIFAAYQTYLMWWRHDYSEFFDYFPLLKPFLFVFMYWVVYIFAVVWAQAIVSLFKGD